MSKIILILLFFYPSFLIAQLSGYVGAGGSFIQQEYVLFEQDTSSLTSEGKFVGNLQYKIKGENWRFTQRGDISIGTKTFWMKEKLSGKWFRSYGNEQLELRLPYDSGSSGYFKHKLYLTPKVGIADDWSIKGDVQQESKLYTKGSYSPSYHLARLGISTEYSPSFSNALSFGYQFTSRFVPDSIEADYSGHRIDAKWTYYPATGGEVYAYGEFITRRYPHYPDKENDYHEVYVDLEPQIAIVSKIFFVPTYELELYRFAEPTLIDFDYTHHTFSFGVKGELSYSAQLSTSVKFLTASADTAIDGETYSELSFPLEFELFKSRKVWLSATEEPGWRFYEGENDSLSFYSNYFFNDVSLIGNLYITKKIKLSVVGSYSPEWHKVSSDDFKMSYISATVRYLF